MTVPLIVEIPRDGKMHVILTQICYDGHVMGQFLDSMNVKYPNVCNVCDDDLRNDNYPWTIQSQVIQAPIPD